MGAITHSDPYSIFMRKIGYSVGLENTLDRLTELERHYVSSKDITTTSWDELVCSGWGLKSSDNITDVFSSLRFIHRTVGDIGVLENLDSMAIACELLSHQEETKRENARAFIFLWSLLVNDGEIFINLLLADFEKNKIKEILTAMIEHKRSILNKVLPGKESRQRISRIVTIERQISNKGSASIGKTGRLLKRTESLEGSKRTKPLETKRFQSLSDEKQEILQISDDYFRKVPPRRKDWARSLGLWEDGTGLTRQGLRFKEILTECGYITKDGFFVFWPMKYELIRAGFRPNLLQVENDLWETLIKFANAYSGIEQQLFTIHDGDKTVHLINKMMNVYRSLHVRKSLLRRELAITVAYPAVVALAICGFDQAMINLPEALNKEQRGSQRRIALRNSKISGAAISIKP